MHILAGIAFLAGGFGLFMMGSPRFIDSFKSHFMYSMLKDPSPFMKKMISIQTKIVAALLILIGLDLIFNGF